jgi:hypothetical protein
MSGVNVCSVGWAKAAGAPLFCAAPTRRAHARRWTRGHGGSAPHDIRNAWAAFAHPTKP